MQAEEHVDQGQQEDHEADRRPAPAWPTERDDAEDATAAGSGRRRSGRCSTVGAGAPARSARPGLVRAGRRCRSRLGRRREHVGRRSWLQTRTARRSGRCRRASRSRSCRTVRPALPTAPTGLCRSDGVGDAATPRKPLAPVGRQRDRRWSRCVRRRSRRGRARPCVGALGSVRPAQRRGRRSRCTGLPSTETSLSPALQRADGLAAPSASRRQPRSGSARPACRRGRRPGATVLAGVGVHDGRRSAVEGRRPARRRC